jgi:hypothetical protein
MNTGWSQRNSIQVPCLLLRALPANRVCTVYIYATIRPRLRALTRLSYLLPSRVFAQSDPASILLEPVAG